MSLLWLCLKFLMVRLRLCTFVRNHPTGGVSVLLDACHQETPKSHCPLTGDVNIDHVVKMMSARSHRCEITVFSLYSLWGDILKPSNYSVNPPTFTNFSQFR